MKKGEKRTTGDAESKLADIEWKTAGEKN